MAEQRRQKLGPLALGWVLFGAPAVGTEIGARAPPLSVIEWHNTAPLTLGGLKGKVVLLDFWGVWCTPCREEMPQVVKLHRRLGGDGLVIVGVHTPMKANQIPDFLRENGIAFAVAVDTGDTARAYGVDAFPAYVLIDPAGNIVSVSDHPPPPGAVAGLLDGSSRRR